jgi:hypothetical protein
VSAPTNATVGVASWSRGTWSSTAGGSVPATAAAVTSSTDLTRLSSRLARHTRAEKGWGSTATYRACGPALAPWTVK